MKIKINKFKTDITLTVQDSIPYQAAMSMTYLPRHRFTFLTSASKDLKMSAKCYVHQHSFYIQKYVIQTSGCLNLILLTTDSPQHTVTWCRKLNCCSWDRMIRECCLRCGGRSVVQRSKQYIKFIKL